MPGSTSSHDILIQARTLGLTQAQTQVNALYGQAQASIRGLSADVQRFGHHTFTAFAIFKGLAIYRGFGYVTQSLSQGVEAALNFRYAMAQVNSLIQVSDEQLQAYSNTIMELGKRVPQTLQQLAEGMYDIVSSGFTGAEALFIVEKASMAAVAGATDLRNAVQAGIATMNAFGKSLDDLNHIYDVHFQAVKMGIFTYEQLNQVLGRVTASAGLAGQSMETAFGALVAISRSGFGGVAFAEGATRVARFFQELTDASALQKINALGVATEDSFGRMRNAIDIVADIQGKMATMTEAARTALANQIFTNIRSVQGFQVLVNSLDLWREAQMGAIFAAEAMPSAYEKMADEVKNTLTIIQNQFTIAMTNVTDFFTPVVKGFSTMFENLSRIMLPFSVALGAIILKYIQMYAAGKLVEAQNLKMAFTTKMNAAAIEREALARRWAIAQAELHLLRTGEVVSAELKHLFVLHNKVQKIKEVEFAQQKQDIAIKMAIATLSQQEQAEYMVLSTKYKSILATYDQQKALYGVGAAEQHVINTTNQLSIQEFKHLVYLHDNVAVLSRQQLEEYKLLALKHKKLLAAYDEERATRGLINANYQHIQSLKLEKMHLSQATQAKLVGAASSMLMIGSMVAMAYNMKELTAVMLGLQTGMMALQALYPIFIGLSTALTGARSAEAGATWSLATASAALQATYGNVAAIAALVAAAAIGTAVAVGVMNSQLGATTETTEEYTDTLSQLEDANASLEESIESVVDKLIEEGHTLGFITQQVEALVNASRGVGPEMVSGLATRHFAMVGETAIVTPTFATTEKGGFTEEAQQALVSLGLGGLTPKTPGAFLEVQAILKEYVTSTETWKQTIGEIFTKDIFGTSFGSSLIALWQDYNQELAVVDEKHQEVFNAAKQYVADYASNYKASLLASIEPITPKELAKKLGLRGYWGEDKGIKVFIESVHDPTGMGAVEGAIYTYEELKNIWVETQLQNDETYKQTMAVLDEWYTIGDIWKGAGYSFENITATIEQEVKNAMEKIGDVMAVDEVVDAILEHTDELEAAGFRWQGVADNWDELATTWATIQQKWQALQLIETFLNVATALTTIPTQMLSGQAMQAQSTLAGPIGQALEQTIGTVMTPLEQILWQLQHPFMTLPTDYYNQLTEQAQETTVIVDADEMTQLQRDIYLGLYPILTQILPQLLFGEGGGGLIDLLQGILDMGDIWEIIGSDIEEDAEDAFNEMVDEWLEMLRGANGFSDAIETFVDQSAILEDAGFYFREVAGGWDQLGTEWARIQAQFKVVEMINTFRVAAAAMTEWGITLPEGFENSMFNLMQLMASTILPDFQSVIDGLLDNIGSADFWDALAQGIAEADIKQNNSIVLAPYIVIEEGMDNEAILELVHGALVDEATRNGFSWTN